jgi:hypothetical protein
MNDEATTSFYARFLNQNWHWNMFFNFNKVPLGLYWIMALFFRIVSPSFFSLWLFPALVSLITLVLGYGVCRIYFSKSFSFLWALGWGLSFWPLYFYRFNEPAGLLPLWECFSFLLLGVCFKKPDPSPRSSYRWLLGCSVGLGFYFAFQFWVLVAFVLILAIIFCGIFRNQRDGKKSFWFPIFLPIFLIPLPLVLSYFFLPANTYIKNLSIFQGEFSWSQYLPVVGSNLCSFFWGVSPSINYFAYKPLWGGFLNPILGSLFWIGLIEFFGHWRKLIIIWIGCSVILFLLPSFLLKNLELFRFVLVVPFLFFFTALGFQALLNSLQHKVRLMCVILVWFSSFSFDFYRLAIVYPAFWKSHLLQWDQYGKQRQCYDAFQVLDKLQKTQGPGLVLNEFTVPLEMDSREQSLNLACYPFDAYQNPKWGFEKAHWAALFVETPDIPYFHRHFPNSTWYDLGPAIYQYIPNQPYSYKMVIFPVTAQNKNTLHRWANANYFLQGMIYQSLCPISTSFRRDISRQMDQNYSLFQGDPFLESHYWITLAGNLQRDNNLEEAWKALQQGLKQGYPDPQKCYLLGFFLFKAGQYDSARAAYLAAAKFDSRFMPPESALKELNRLADNNKRSSSKQNKIKAE